MPHLNHLVSAIVAIVGVTLLPTVTLAESPVTEPVNVAVSNKSVAVRSLQIEADIEFNFEGCRQNAQTNDVFCVGTLHSQTEQSFRVYRDFIGIGTEVTTITDSKGNDVTANKIMIGDKFTCDANCDSQIVKLAAGENYKTIIIFRNTKLSSDRIALKFSTNTIAKTIKIQDIAIETIATK
jgi:hypothetical protein